MRTLDKLESRQRIREIRELWLWWDPIGVSAMPEAADEYDAYLAPTLRLLERNASSAELAAFLDSVAYGRMGLSGVTTPASEFAARLQSWFASNWASTRVPGA